MGEKIGLFGGSFNPVHCGHLIVARSVAEALELDRVVILPSRTPPHKTHSKALAPAERRSAMVRLAIEDESGFDFSDHDLTCDGPSYTLNTIAHFRQVAGAEAELFWLIGADSLLELHSWYRVGELAASCRIVTAVRHGFEAGNLPELRKTLDASTVEQLLADILETPHIDISSTDIRRRVAQQRSIRYLVPQAVARYITDTGLYCSK